jgi:lantibiotic modifying enzyme
MSTENLDLIRSKLAEIAADLTKDAEESLAPCLFSGRMGEALFFMYYSMYTKNDTWRRVAMERIDKVWDMIDQGFGFHTYCRGLAGIFWSAEHFMDLGLIDNDARESLEEFDRYLAEKMLEELALKKFDFLHGGLGLALYLLKRRRTNPDLDKYFDGLIDGLERCSIRVDDDTVRWNALLDIRMGESGPNIGLAHGMSSIAIMLSKLIRAGVTVDRSTRLLTQTVNYILQQELQPPLGIARFPSLSLEKPNSPSSPSRMAWCYGDLGVGLALYEASLAVNNDIWRNKGLEVLTHSCSRRDLNENLINDAGICHGSAGVAHFFHRLFLKTGQPEFQEAATYWQQQALSQASYTPDIPGFAGYTPYAANEKLGISDYRGLLIGAAGIGLSLLDAVSDIPPDWDECLLLS